MEKHWVYEQATGKLSLDSDYTYQCYSGKGEGRNNPSLEHKVAVGPIPRGLWKMTGIYNSPNTGPSTIKLEPVGHDALGRSAFRIHGDNRTHDASNGCIILSPLQYRERIYKICKSLLVV